MWSNLGFIFILATSPLYKKDVRFLGFSNNEGICAWEIHYRTASKTEFILARVVDVKTNQVVATFKVSGQSEHDDFKQAESKKEWLALKNKAKFWGKIVPMDGTVRLAVDEDTRAALKAEKNSIDIKGESGSPVGYKPVVYLMNGQLISTGYFRLPGKEQQVITGTVEVYRSKSAFHLAILNEFEVTAEGVTQTVPMAAVFKLPEVIGTSSLGSLKLMNSQLRIGADLFREMFPEAPDDYEKYIGKDWD